MLILGRKVRERVKIGDDITVIICAIHHNQVRVGFEAPEGVIVHREEIYDKIKRSKNTEEE